MVYDASEGDDDDDDDGDDDESDHSCNGDCVEGLGDTMFVEVSARM